VQNDDDTVSVSLSATQTNGSVKTYVSTYTVANGALVAANITPDWRPELTTAPMREPTATPSARRMTRGQNP
jgi:hypothetical protein